MKYTHKKRMTHKRKPLSKTRSRKSIKKGKSVMKRPVTRKRRILKGGQEDEKEKEECPICYEELGNPADDITLSCHHTFHKRCMRSTCNAYRNRYSCLCPMCRKPLTQEEMQEVGFSPLMILQTPSEIYNLPPYLATIDDFKIYINNKLRAPTRSPLDALQRELDEFLGTDSLPFEIYDKIMEFDLEQVGPLYRYRFTRIVDNPPANRLNKKYFFYTDHNEETGDLDEYAYDVYEV
jgi:hypothetical protein